MVVFRWASGREAGMRFRSPQQLWFGIQVGCICMLWYGSSSAQSIINKFTLQGYPYPLTVALSSLLNNVLCAIPLIRILHISQVKLTSSYLMRTVVPISVGRALAVSSAYFSLWRVPVSYAQTVKSTMPIFTVFITRLLLKERHSKRVYASLLPIILGVFTASATELQFDGFGLAASLFSTSVFAFLNVLAKKVFDETGMHPIVLLSLNSQLASLMLFPVWLVRDGYSMWSDLTALGVNNGDEHGATANGRPNFLFLLLLFASGLLSFVQNMCAFVLIHQLTTLSYSVSNAAKRVFVIFLSLVTFRNPVTPLNACGMALSILGVFIYNRVKAAEKAHKPSIGHHEEMNGGGEKPTSTLFRRNHKNHFFDAGGLHSTDSDVRLMLSSN